MPCWAKLWTDPLQNALYKYGVTELFSKLSSHTLKHLKLLPTSLHLDGTSFHTDGVYNSEEPKQEGVIHITQGYSRDHRPDLNQVTLTLIAENHVGIPILMQPGDGNASDVTTFQQIAKQHLKSLQEAYDNPILVADAALYTEETLQILQERKSTFITRVPATLKEAKGLLDHPEELEWHPIDEISDIDQQPYTYAKASSEYGGVKQQWFVYASQPAKERESKTSLKKLRSTGEKECKLLKKLQKEQFFCEADAKKALLLFQKGLKITTLGDRTIRAIPRYSGKGRPKKEEAPSRIDYVIEASLVTPLSRKEEKLMRDGLFILSTNDHALTAPLVLQEYKGQQRVERGFRWLKSPEFLADSFFLKKPERIEAMLFIMTLCLLVYAALEYTIRQKLQEEEPFFPDQKGIPTQKPTTRWVFSCFFAIHVLMMSVVTPPMVVGMKMHQRRLLGLLGERYRRFYE